MHGLRILFKTFDFSVFVAVLLLSGLGLLTMYSAEGTEQYFGTQLSWILIACVAFFLALLPDYRFLRLGNASFYLFIGITILLGLVLLIGEVNLGAQRRFDLGFLSIQPAEPAKLVLIIVLAKYFSKRHEAIGAVRHVVVSGLYTLVLFGLIFIQPDFGSGIILSLIWLGMVLVAGIKFRHLALVFMLGVVSFAMLWQFVFFEYQKQRIMTFLDPLSDIQGAGYNAYQSTVAVGSGQLFGKGIGYGTQSKLSFLPEYQTDFIFAAFAEEWGFLGVVGLFALFGFLIVRIMWYAVHAASNFETLFASGVAILLVSHFFIHIGMNIGLLPVTGTTIPFLSYGGSHLLIEYVAVAMVLAMSRYAKIQKNAPDTEALFLSNK
ncbi:MAG: FtsW/RodA/SpoVE family cell cycle protein [Candidatus Paceibacteria bacterium]